MRLWTIFIAMLMCTMLYGADNLIPGYNFSSATGLLSGATLEALVKASRPATTICDLSNTSRWFSAEQFEIGYDSGSTTPVIRTKSGSSLTGTNVFGNWWYDGTNAPNYLLAFMGYKKLAVSTNNMVAYSDGGTTATAGTWDKMFDNSLVSCSSTATINNANSHFYVIDLGANYTGWVVYRVLVINDSTTANSAIWGGTASSVTNVVGLSSHYLGPVNFTFGPRWQEDWQYHTTDEKDIWRTNTFVKAINGRYVGLGLYGQSLSGTFRYSIAEILVFGSDKGFQELGGW